MISYKICGKCKENKDVSQFPYQNKKLNKIYCYCKKCVCSIQKDYNENRGGKKVREKYEQSDSYKNYIKKRDSSDRYKSYNKEYSKTDNFKTNQKKYRSNNKHKINFWAANRRAMVKNATPKWLSKEQLQSISDIYKLAKQKEKETGMRYNVDHIVPINSDIVCGLHVPWNLQLLEDIENFKKGNKLL